MASSQVNGISGGSQSAFIDHLFKYPVISDSVNTVKQNKYGQHGITLTKSAYDTITKPVAPYLAKPYEYVSPYVKKADDLGDKTLSSIDERLPIVKKPTGELYGDAKSLVTFPYRKSIESKDHVFDVYQGERKQLGEGGVVNIGKAMVVTALVITTETLSYVRSLLSKTKQQVGEKVNN